MSPGPTATAIYQKVSEIQNALIELRALLADLGITDTQLPLQERRPRTGWRFVRGTHAGTYVRDPAGTDRLPPGYDLTPRPHPGQPPPPEPFGSLDDLERP